MRQHKANEHQTAQVKYRANFIRNSNDHNWLPVFDEGTYQAFKIVGYARRNEIFLRSVRAFPIINYCALTTAIFLLGSEPYLLL